MIRYISPINVLFFGFAGVGKGEMSERAGLLLGVPHIATGDLFRHHLSTSSDLGNQARSYIDAGQLVPNAITIAMALNRIAQNDTVVGFIGDGFPRDVDQTIALNRYLSATRRAVSMAVNLTASTDTIIERLCYRLVCKNSHVFNGRTKKPKVDGICDICGEILKGRDDDKNPNAVAARHREFIEKTVDVVSIYHDRGVVVDIDANLTIDDVWVSIKSVLMQRFSVV